MSQSSDNENQRQDDLNVPNPYEVWKKMYFAAEDAAAATVREAIKTKGFAQTIDSMLDNYLLQHKLFTDSSNKLLDKSPFPSKADVARVAELVISIEDKIDRIETGFITQLSRMVQNTSIMSEMINGLKNPSEMLELKTSVQNSEAVLTSLINRVEQLEQSINRLENLCTGLKSEPSSSASQPNKKGKNNPAT
ncbi:MAG: hypothetical protein ACM3MK_11130 [Chitinophagales bacterium]